MEDVQEQRHVCKICSKSCISGKSLGGHMRIHSAFISAMKKAAEVEFDSQMDLEGGDDQEVSLQNSKNQSNSTFLDQEKIKNCATNMGLGDDDTKNSYELRENPKKSWKNFDVKHEDAPSDGTCKECGKVFPSLKALSGHMRCHSVKKTAANQNHCKECGKGFDSIRALFGHMKSHSNKSRRVTDESAESSSDLGNLCPLRRKRSRILYKIDPTPSSNGVEFGEVEDVALCLIMLSRGVKNWDRSNSLTESTGNDSAYFRDESVCKDKDIDTYDGGDSSFDGDMVWKMDKSVGKVDPRILGSGIEVKVDSEISDDGVLKSSCCDKTIVGGHDTKTLTDFDEKFDLKMLGSTSSVEVDTCSLSVAEANSKIKCNVIASFQCPMCLRIFSSGQALGGHKRAHYTGFTDDKTIESVAMDGDLDLNLPMPIDESEKGGVKIDQWWFEPWHEPKEEPIITD